MISASDVMFLLIEHAKPLRKFYCNFGYRSSPGWGVGCCTWYQTGKSFNRPFLKMGNFYCGFLRLSGGRKPRFQSASSLWFRHGSPESLIDKVEHSFCTVVSCNFRPISARCQNSDQWRHSIQGITQWFQQRKKYLRTTAVHVEAVWNPRGKQRIDRFVFHVWNGPASLEIIKFFVFDELKKK